MADKGFISERGFGKPISTFAEIIEKKGWEFFYAHKVSRPESRSDPIGGSEPVSETRDSGLGLFT